MNKLNLLSLVIIAALTSACGGGGTNADGLPTPSSSSSLSGGTSSFPKTVSLSCKNTNTSRVTIKILSLFQNLEQQGVLKQTVILHKTLKLKVVSLT